MKASPVRITSVPEQLNNISLSMADIRQLLAPSDAGLKVDEGGPLPESTKTSCGKDELEQFDPSHVNDEFHSLNPHAVSEPMTEGECADDYQGRCEKYQCVVDELTIENHNMKIEIDFYKKLFRKFTNTD